MWEPRIPVDDNPVYRDLQRIAVNSAIRARGAQRDRIRLWRNSEEHPLQRRRGVTDGLDYLSLLVHT